MNGALDSTSRSRSYSVPRNSTLATRMALMNKLSNSTSYRVRRNTRRRDEERSRAESIAGGERNPPGTATDDAKTSVYPLLI